MLYFTGFFITFKCSLLVKRAFLNAYMPKTFTTFRNNGMSDKMVNAGICNGSVINKKTIIKIFSCDKCLVLEQQLRESLQELGSPDVIIELVRKENTVYTTLKHEATNLTPSSHVSAVQEVHGKRETVTQRRLNGRKMEKLMTYLLTPCS